MNAPVAVSPYPPTDSFSPAPGNAPAFRFDGGAADYFGVALLSFVLSLFTAGIGTPWALCMHERWRCQHTMIGGRRLKFTGRGLSLLGLGIKWLLLSIITLGIYGFWIIPSYHKWIVEHTEFE